MYQVLGIYYLWYLQINIMPIGAHQGVTASWGVAGSSGLVYRWTRLLLYRRTGCWFQKEMAVLEVTVESNYAIWRRATASSSSQYWVYWHLVPSYVSLKVVIAPNTLLYVITVKRFREPVLQRRPFWIWLVMHSTSSEL